MHVRNAQSTDAVQLKILLAQLGYSNTDNFFTHKLELLINHPDHQILVGEHDDKLVGFISVYFLTLLGTQGDLAIIDYFAVDECYRGKKIGTMLEQACVELSRKRNCVKIQLHCSTYRTEAHSFYKSKGYTEHPKYFNKEITNI